MLSLFLFKKSILNEVNKKQEQLEKLKFVIIQQNDLNNLKEIQLDANREQVFTPNVLPSKDRCKQFT